MTGWEIPLGVLAIGGWANVYLWRRAAKKWERAAKLWEQAFNAHDKCRHKINWLSNFEGEMSPRMAEIVQAEPGHLAIVETEVEP